MVCALYIFPAFLFFANPVSGINFTQRHLGIVQHKFNSGPDCSGSGKFG